MDASVDFITFCYSRDKEKLYSNLDMIIDSHNYRFNKIHVIHQRTKPTIDKYNCHEINDSEVNDLLERWNINPINKEADHYTHGPTGPHFWKNHTINHLKGLEVSNADYIVFSDSDCCMKNQRPDKPWIDVAINKLQKDQSVLCVCPSDGEGERKLQIMSQQLFIVDRERFSKIDFDLPFTGFYDGSPFPEYFFMMEGKIGRYMEHNNLWRYVLPAEWRYWHGNI